MKDKKKEPTTDEIAEDWCFICKDGGDLMLCDHKGCSKVYHGHCLDPSGKSLKTAELICGRHKCFACKKDAKCYCFCCPKAICGHCDTDEKFVRVRKNRGFCDECMDLILHIEECRDCDSYMMQADVDYEDPDTYEGLFKGYWDIIKEEEGLTLEIIYAADVRLNKGENYTSKSSKSARVRNDDEDADASLSDSDEDDVAKRSISGKSKSSASLSDSDEDDMAKRSTGRKKKRFAVKKKRSGVFEFEGWGSKSLISFLSSIGQDTTKELSCIGVENIILNYITQKNLFEPGRKKNVVCDDKLFSIFKKKKIIKNKIYGLLGPHFLKNAEELSDEEEEDKDETTPREVKKDAKDLGISKKLMKSSGCKRKNIEKEVARPKKHKEEMRKSNREEVVSVCRMPKEKKVIPEVQQSLSAAIITQNIKLIYLRRSLVEELIKQFDTAEDKILGSFVKVKMDQSDSQLSRSHQLLKVTGIKEPSAGGMSTEVLLEVSNIPQAISLSLLSDADLSEEDCEDLRQRVESGLVPKPTVDALLQKAKLLHVDITKHWIEKELMRLQNLIDQANEKGRRRELDQYLQQRTLLKKPIEQERRFKQQPKVYPESLQTKPPPPPASPSSSDDSAGSHSSDNDSASEGSSPKIIKLD